MTLSFHCFRCSFPLFPSIIVTVWCYKHSLTDSILAINMYYCCYYYYFGKGTFENLELRLLVRENKSIKLLKYQLIWIIFIKCFGNNLRLEQFSRQLEFGDKQPISLTLWKMLNPGLNANVCSVSPSCLNNSLYSVTEVPSTLAPVFSALYHRWSKWACTSSGF